MGTDLTQPIDLLDAIRTGSVPAVESDEDTALRIVEEVLRAGDEGEVFNKGGTVAASQLVGVRFELRQVRLMEGAIEGATFPVYVLLEAMTENGERFVINTGAARIMAQAWRAQELGLLPKWMSVIEVAKARPGLNAPLGLAIV